MRRLADDEKELWARVVATVKPLRRAPQPIRVGASDRPRPDTTSTAKVRQPLEKPPPARVTSHVGGLDASWDRRLARGMVRPDISIDLHGHSLATAHDLLDRRLEEAVRSGVRLVLLITGKPPRDERYPIVRGAIRASIDDWLHASRHAPEIAAVRDAHPRHGGAGALYVVLRRRRSPH